MLGLSLDRLLRSTTTEQSPDTEKFLSNALFHTFLVAARNLCGFLYCKEPGNRRYDDDILAEDFFTGPVEWGGIRPSSLPDLAKGSLANDISRRLLHLTYHRAEQTRLSWSSSRIAWELNKALEVFVSSIAPSRMCHGLAESVVALSHRLQQFRSESSGSIDDATNGPLTTIWHEPGFGTTPRRVTPDGQP